jgi:hypothetical protein
MDFSEMMDPPRHALAFPRSALGWVAVGIATAMVVAGGLLGLHFYSDYKLERALAALELHRAEWADQVKIAQATPRIAVAPQVAALQQLKRKLAGLPSPPELQTALSLEEQSEKITIDGFLAFMEQDSKSGELLGTAQHLSAEENQEILPLRRRFYPEQVAAEEATERARKKEQDRLAAEQVASERKADAAREAARVSEEEAQKVRASQAEEALKLAQAEELTQEVRTREQDLRNREARAALIEQERQQRARAQAETQERIRTWIENHRKSFFPLSRALTAEIDAYEKGGDLYPGCKTLADAATAYFGEPANAWPAELQTQRTQLAYGLREVLAACPSNNRYKMGEALPLIRAGAAGLLQ